MAALPPRPSANATSAARVAPRVLKNSRHASRTSPYSPRMPHLLSGCQEPGVVRAEAVPMKGPRFANDPCGALFPPGTAGPETAQPPLWHNARAQGGRESFLMIVRQDLGGQFSPEGTPDPTLRTCP